MLDLTIEFNNAILAIEQRHRDRLIVAGVPECVAKPSEGRHHWGVMKVRADGDHHFIPDAEDGREAFVSFAFHAGNIVDLVAWHPAVPGNWRWRIGDTPILNVDAMERRWPGDGPLMVFSTPLDCLRGGGDGVVILDWNATGDIRRLAMEDTICGPQAIIHRLDAILRTPVRMPRYRLMEMPRAAA